MRNSQKTSPTASRTCQSPAEVEVLRSLMPEPEPQIGEAVVDAQVLAAEAAEHDHGEGHQEELHSQTLARGSAPPTIGARNRPPATHAVAIQKMASWRCQVRSRLKGK